jgi:hypothetical protein
MQPAVSPKVTVPITSISVQYAYPTSEVEMLELLRVLGLETVVMHVGGKTWAALKHHLAEAGRAVRNFVDDRDTNPLEMADASVCIVLKSGIPVPCCQPAISDEMARAYDALGIEVVTLEAVDPRDGRSAARTFLAEDVEKTLDLFQRGYSTKTRIRPVKDLTLREFHVGEKPPRILCELALAAGVGYEEVALQDGRRAWVLGGACRQRAEACLQSLHEAPCSADSCDAL